MICALEEWVRLDRDYGLRLLELGCRPYRHCVKLYVRCAFEEWVYLEKNIYFGMLDGWVGAVSKVADDMGWLLRIIWWL